MSSHRTPGRALVIAVIVVVLVGAAALTPTRVWRIPHEIVGYAPLVLCVFLYRGAGWARWVTSILLLLLGTLGIVGGLAKGNLDATSLVFLALFFGFIACAAILLFVPTVRAWFKRGTDAPTPKKKEESSGASAP
jgi:hypothetical protein